MKCVFKYELDWTQTSQYRGMACVMLRMPKNARVIHVADQAGHLCLWALFDAEDADDREPRRFYIVGTGQAFGTDVTLRHLGTALIFPMVLHVFEETP